MAGSVARIKITAMCEQQIPQLDIDYASYTALTLSVTKILLRVQKKRYIICFRYFPSVYAVGLHKIVSNKILIN